MAKAPTLAEGARDGTAQAGDSPDNAAVTDDSSAATPAQPDIIPEPFNPHFQNRGPDTPGGAPAPGTSGLEDDENRVEVETTGEFMVQDPYTLDLVPHEGSARVRRTSFIDEKLASGQLKLVE